MNIARLILLVTAHSLLLTAAQVFLKFAMEKLPPFSEGLHFLKSAILSWQLASSGVCFITSMLLWFHIIKNFPFSIAYPMMSMGYVFGMIAAMIFFHEPVSLTKWLGIIAIMAGCYLIAK